MCLWSWYGCTLPTLPMTTPSTQTDRQVCYTNCLRKGKEKRKEKGKEKAKGKGKGKGKRKAKEKTAIKSLRHSNPAAIRAWCSNTSDSGPRWTTCPHLALAKSHADWQRDKSLWKRSPCPQLGGEFTIPIFTAMCNAWGLKRLTGQVSGTTHRCMSMYTHAYHSHCAQMRMNSASAQETEEL